MSVERKKIIIDNDKATRRRNESAQNLQTVNHYKIWPCDVTKSAKDHLTGVARYLGSEPLSEVFCQNETTHLLGFGVDGHVGNKFLHAIFSLNYIRRCALAERQPLHLLFQRIHTSTPSSSASTTTRSVAATPSYSSTSSSTSSSPKFFVIILISLAKDFRPGAARIVLIR